MNNPDFEIYGLLLPATKVEGIFPVIWKQLNNGNLYIVVDNDYFILDKNNIIVSIINDNDNIEISYDSSKHVYGFITITELKFIGSKKYIFESVYGNDIYNSLDPFAKLLFAKFYRLNRKIPELLELTHIKWKTEGFDYKLDIYSFLPNEIIKSKDLNNSSFSSNEELLNIFKIIRSSLILLEQTICFVTNDSINEHELYVGNYKVSYRFVETNPTLRCFIDSNNIVGYSEFASQYAQTSTVFENSMINPLLSNISEREFTDEKIAQNEIELNSIISNMEIYEQ